MAITRSQIARQLLAAGGVSFESPGNTTLQRVLPRMDGQRPGFYGPDAGEGGMESSFGADTYSDGGDNPIDSGEAAGGSRAQFAATAEALGTPQTPGALDNFRSNQLKKQLDLMYGNTRLSPSFFANMFRGPKQEVYDKDFLDIDQYGMSGKDLTRSRNIQNALDEFQKTGRLSQSQFETAFGSNVPTTTPGGNNEVMARKPMIPKLPTDIEPEKSDYAEFVQRFTLPERFRLNAGGSPGNTTSQRVLPRADGRRPGYYGSDAGFGDDDYKDESASFDAGSGSGGSDSDFAAARDAMYGTTRSGGGGTTNVTGFGPGGRPTPVISYTQKAKDLAEIDAFLSSLDEEQKGKGTGFDVKDVQPTSGYGGKRDKETATALESFLLEAGPGFLNKADGGSIRQAYGLGSIVKKVTGAVKKVVKSDVGKAALIGAAAFGIPGMGATGGLGGGIFGRASFGGTAPGIFGFGGIGNALTAGSMSRAFGKDAMMGDPAQFFNVDQGFLGKALKFMKTPRGALSTIGGLTAVAGVLSPEQEQEVDSLSSRISDRTGIDVEQIRKEVQTAYANNNTESLRTKYPFLITESAAAKAEGGRIGFDDGGTPQEMFPDNIDDIGPKRSAPKLRKMPEFKGDEVEPSGIMMVSNMENDNILENLFEKYLDMGLSPEDAAIKAREEFDRMSKAEESDRMMANAGGIMNPNDEMLNMDGNEMDLRGGGFVPLGEYEKKDDVPARLSKNEFVFTADAVRAAGGGSVDRGADLMYKTMKQLENKVA